MRTLRAKRKGEARDLTHREAHALAGQWYLWFVAQHEENPRDPQYWRLSGELMADAVMNATPYWDAHDPLVDQTQRGKEPGVREEVHPILTDEAKTAQFLACKREVLSREAMTTFLDCVLDAFIAACDLLERRARGDYTPDALPQTFPVFEPKKPKATSGLTAPQLFTAYIPAADLSEGSVRRWRSVFNALDARLEGRSIEGLSEHEAQQWVASLVTKKRNAFTVMNTYVASLRAVCAWAVKQRLITVNPFTKASVKVPENQKPKSRSPGRETKAFTDDEVKLILRSALAIEDTQQTSGALRRWVPWLLAYTGARAGEITQLREQDVIMRDGVVALRLTREAGTIKTREDRTVPLHEHVIEQGFLDYVKKRGGAPLFYEADERAPVSADITKPKTTRAADARDDLGRWIRSIGITDPQVQPTHAWRHTFKQRAARYEISDRFSDAITGHAAPTEGRNYGAPTLLDMANALRRFPRYSAG
jgi:integrase